MFVFAQLLEDAASPIAAPQALPRAKVRLEMGEAKPEAIAIVPPFAGYGSHTPYLGGDRVVVGMAYGEPAGGCFVLFRVGTMPTSALVDSQGDTTIRSRTTGNINLLLEQAGAAVNVGSGLVAAMAAVMMHQEAYNEIRNLKEQIDALTQYLATAGLKADVGTPLSGAPGAVSAVAIPITGGKASLNLKTTPGT